MGYTLIDNFICGLIGSFLFCKRFLFSGLVIWQVEATHICFANLSDDVLKVKVAVSHLSHEKSVFL